MSIENSTLKLSELMRGLEIPPSTASESPEFFFMLGQAIASQAKQANPIFGKAEDMKQHFSMYNK